MLGLVLGEGFSKTCPGYCWGKAPARATAGGGLFKNMLGLLLGEGFFKNMLGLLLGEGFSKNMLGLLLGEGFSKTCSGYCWGRAFGFGANYCLNCFESRKLLGSFGGTRPF